MRSGRLAVTIVILLMATGSAAWLALKPKQSQDDFEFPDFVSESQSGTLTASGVINHPSSDAMIERLRAIQATTASSGKTSGANSSLDVDDSVLEPPNPSVPPMSAAVFFKVLSEAVASDDAGMIRRIMDEAPRSLECVEGLKALIMAENSSPELRQYASETLMKLGTIGAVEFVVDQIQAAQEAGNPTLRDALLQSLNTSTTVEGAKVLIDWLLSAGRYADHGQDLTDSMRSAARGALLKVPDRERVGSMTADLYLDLLANNRQEALQELIEGISYPGMFSELAVRASQTGSTESARPFLERLAQVNDQAAVSAFAQVAAREPALLNETAAQLYTWTLTHPDQAQLGLFMEYLTDSTRPPAQRILAAYGLSGIPEPEKAIQALNKALASETNPAVRLPLSQLQTFLLESQIRQSKASLSPP
jgi:hypothetical protein